MKVPFRDLRASYLELKGSEAEDFIRWLESYAESIS